MNMTLTRNGFFSTGIFGILDSADELLSLFTLEHSYPQGDPGSETYVPKVPTGIYICKRGIHQLAPTPLVPNPQSFETFEITNVPGHTEILIHPGNYNADSSGCVLVGLFRSANDSIMQSRSGFKLFMSLQGGTDSFQLEIK